MDTPSEKSMQKVERLVEGFTKKSGTCNHPNADVTQVVKNGLAANIDELKKPLCPCRFYPDKEAEAKHRTWICPCADMQIYKYCHCMLFVAEDGMPITEHLPEDHEGKKTYGLVNDPSPELGCALRDKAAEREEERRQRPS